MNKDDKYQPSNGTEGVWFTEKYCMQCLHCDPDPNGKKQCDILCASLCYDVNDPEYPKEWIYDTQDNPKCTEWKKWDWGNDGDPNDDDNPKRPPLPPDPRQINIFPLYPDEKHYDQKITKKHYI